MGRPKTIDRDHVLDAAEEIVATRGAGALSVGAVAEAAGISKGGVQSCFGSKEAMITAMLDRWMAADDARFERLVDPGSSPVERMKAHIAATRGYDEFAQTRIASLLATLLQQPEHVEATRRWYEARLKGLEGDDIAARRARLAFLANEGAFYLRFLGLLPIDSDAWQAIYEDIDDLIEARL